MSVSSNIPKVTKTQDNKSVLIELENSGWRFFCRDCNIDIENYVIARPGVYAVKVNILNSNKILKGIANLGYRPTFNQKEILLEVHIFNFSRNLYNKHLTIEFIDFIRKEKKFKNINQLKKQINLDLKIAKKKLK